MIRVACIAAVLLAACGLPRDADRTLEREAAADPVSEIIDERLQPL